MLRFLLVLCLPVLLFAGELHLTLASVSEDQETATIETGKIEIGVSGFIVRHFTKDQSSIIANAIVIDYNESKKKVTIALSEYTGLRQNSLPSGRWEAEKGDEAVLAFGYGRALLLAPEETIWRRITSQIKSVDWIHPDSFATYISYHGHPTPIKEDIKNFCTLMNNGLLYIYAQSSLFTFDCQSFSLLQITPAPFKRTDDKLPFFSRIEEIRAAWWGEGSDPLEAYDPYYMELMVENNPTSKKLYNYIKTHDSNNTQLLDEFEIGEE